MAQSESSEDSKQYPPIGPEKKSYYFHLAKSEGLPAAITELHHEMRELEGECFEGTKGYRPDLFEALKSYRDFSVELWNLRL